MKHPRRNIKYLPYVFLLLALLSVGLNVAETYTGIATAGDYVWVIAVVLLDLVMFFQLRYVIKDRVQAREKLEEITKLLDAVKKSEEQTFTYASAVLSEKEITK